MSFMRCFFTLQPILVQELKIFLTFSEPFFEKDPYKIKNVKVEFKLYGKR